MRIPSIILGALALAATPWLASAEDNVPAAEQTHVIEIDRPYTPGSAFFEDTTLKISQLQVTASENGEKATPGDVANVRFIADQLVTETTPSGLPRALLIRVEKLEITSFEEGEDQNEPKLLLADDTWITARAVGDEVQFKNADGTQIGSQQTAELLDELIGLSDDDPPLPHSETLALGAEHPRKIGETWELDPAKNAKAMSSRKYKLTPDDVAGYASFVGLTEQEGQPCYRVSYSFTIDITLHQQGPVDRADRTTYLRTITMDIPVDKARMEHFFEMRRWVRYDKRSPIPEKPTAPATQSNIYEMHYNTKVTEIEGEDLAVLTDKQKALKEAKDEESKGE